MKCKKCAVWILSCDGCEDERETSKTVDSLSQTIAQYDELLTDICNEYMTVNGDGSFEGFNDLDKRANALLGL